MRKPAPLAAAFALLAGLPLTACGGATPAAAPPPDAVSGATDVAPVPYAGPAPAAPPPHVCEAPIAAPEEVWPRVEAIRALPEDERAARCGLPFVAAFSAWRSPPVDLLGPIAARAAAAGELDAWVAQAAAATPKAAAAVVAMDVVGRFAVGGDPQVAEERRAHWASAPAAATPEIAGVLEEAKLLPELLAEVNAVHELRCLLEVNALGFAVRCTPIHPAATPIAISWSSATRDGVLEKLEVASCEGKSCGKLKKTAGKLMPRYAALVERIKKLASPVYRERLLQLVVLPPFTSRAAG